MRQPSPQSFFVVEVTTGRTLGRRTTSGTFWNRPDSGLNSGVSMNWRKRFARRVRRPWSDSSDRPRFSMSASRSISSTMSLVRLQSNSFTVHLTCNSTSSRSSMLNEGRRSPLYSSISSFARVVNGVCTCATSPSLICQRFGAAISFSVERIRLSRFSSFACSRSLSIVCSSFCSLSKSCDSAAIRSGSSRFSPFILRVSCSLHASSSLYRISKSSRTCGCMRLSISLACRSSAARRCASSISAALRYASCWARSSEVATARANQPRVYRCRSIAFSSRSSASCSESK
mmetsp:Transcript_35890/g.89311  ORF Transcript_35890/g.89311 Transcript_35890/m.89311 type:complete len:288 (+) Transcript_35890:351-1214(+)